MEYHEAANIFPLQEKTIPELADSIRERGLIDPIETLDGKILDGRRRWLACEQAGVEPELKEVVTDDPIQYSLDKNGKTRRHLSVGKLTNIASKANELIEKAEKDAKDRMAAGGGDKRSKKAKAQAKAKSGCAARRTPKKLRATDDVGKALGISGRQVQRGTAIRKKGIPELMEAVDEGKISATKADKIAQTYSKSAQKRMLQEALQPKQKGGRASKDPHPARPNTGNADGDGTDRQRYNAMLAENAAIDWLMRSTLRRLGKDNPHRVNAFKGVIRWLNQTMKGN